MSSEHGTCSECGTALVIGERRMCMPCWTAYWNRQLESVPVERLLTPEEAHLEQVGNELVLMVANLNQQLKLAERSLTERDQTIRFMQERLDALGEDLAQQATYLAFMCDRLAQEEARGDGLLLQNNALAEQLQRYERQEKRNGHRLFSR